MMPKQSNIVSTLDGILLRGYQKKLKTMKKKYFVLFEETASSCSRLEYFDNEKKFKSGSAPKRVIKLKNCFNINRCLNTKHDFVIALSTKDGGFGIVLESEAEMLKWLEVLLNIQRCDDSSNDQPRIDFEHVWQVVVQRRGLAEEKGIFGTYHVCLTPKTITFISIGSQKIADNRIQNIEFLLTTIRRCGDSQCFFYMEVGRQSSIGPGELWLETEDALIAQNMHNMILNAMSNRSDSSIDPMRKRSSSANETSKPVAMLHRKQQAENNTNIASYQSGFIYGRERCDSLPSTSNRNPNNNSNQSLLNIALPLRNILTHVSRPPLDHHRQSNSPPVTTAIVCSESEESSLSIDDQDDNGLLLPFRFHSRSSEGVIAEENNEEILPSDKCNEKDYTSNHSSRLRGNNEECYTLMGPISCDEENTKLYNKFNDNLEMFPFMADENHGTANSINFLEYTSDNINKNCIADAEITTSSELPSRAYSIGSRLEHNKIKMQNFNSALDSDTSTLRVRAFSVGSRAKNPRCEIKRSLVTCKSAFDAKTNKKNGSGNNINLIEVPSYSQSIHVSSSFEKKATSAPLLIQKSQNSFDQMSDLMEIDFSRSRKEICSTSSEKCYPLSMSVPVTNHDQEAFKTFILSSNVKKPITNNLSLKQKSLDNGYLEMKPVCLTSNPTLNPTFIKSVVNKNFDNVSQLLCTSPKSSKTKDLAQNQNEFVLHSKKIIEVNTDILKCPPSIEDTNILKLNETDHHTNRNIGTFRNVADARYVDAYPVSIVNRSNSFLEKHPINKNLNKTISPPNASENNVSDSCSNTEFQSSLNLSCQNDTAIKEMCAKYQLDLQVYKTSNDGLYKSATKYSKSSDNSMLRLSDMTTQTKSSGYEVLQIESDSSLQSNKTFQQLLSVEVDKQFPQLPVDIPSSANSECLPSMPSSSYGRSALSLNTKNATSSICRTLSIGDSLNCFGNNSINNIKDECHISKASRPPSSSSGRELHYASLDLPQGPLAKNKFMDVTSKNMCSGETLFATSSKTNPQRSLTYAKIDFDHRELSNNVTSKLFNSS